MCFALLVAVCDAGARRRLTHTNLSKVVHLGRVGVGVGVRVKLGLQKHCGFGLMAGNLVGVPGLDSTYVRVYLREMHR